MKYILFTIVIIIVIFFERYIISIFSIFVPSNIVFIVLFSYYILRDNRYSLFIIFISSIIIDILNIFPIGITGLIFFLTLIVFKFLNNSLKLNGNMKILVIFLSVLFYEIGLITIYEIYLGYINLINIIKILPTILILTLFIFVITTLVNIIRPEKLKNQIKI